ncbi:ankyrin repeat-containing domain protein [Chaetomidium leptoderma]|uniref:Ankyrin repeat-containing domain protein n=1 Tax=Chaetomidium leptoderma TaxID=669021 RepID=A0AAN6ZTR1_9PEZI|nr:ankyrin repeat-containing domain protein [Chaetomidium leptoderma]
MASFSNLPVEILRMIGGHLSTEVDCYTLAALAATSRYGHWVFNDQLYETDASGASLALLWAAATGRVRTVQLAVTHGANVDFTYNVGQPFDARLRPALRIITAHVPVDGPGPDHPHRQGTALHIATIMGHDEAVWRLLGLGARHTSPSLNLCPCNPRGDLFRRQSWRVNPVLWYPLWRPLHLAVCFGNVSTFATLVERGASLDKTGGATSVPARYPTSLQHAAYAGNFDIVDFILDHPGAVSRATATIDVHGHAMTPLELVYMGSGSGDREPRRQIMRRLVQFGPLLGEDALFRACRSQAFGTAVDLIESGACPQLSSQSLTTMLYYTLKFHEAHRVNLAEDGGDHPIPHHSCYHDSPNILQCDRAALLELLVKRGADINAEFPEESPPVTALMLATEPEHDDHAALKTIQLILDLVYSPRASNSSGMTVVHHLIKRMTTPRTGVAPIPPFRPTVPIGRLMHLARYGLLMLDAVDNEGMTAFDYVYNAVAKHIEQWDSISPNDAVFNVFGVFGGTEGAIQAWRFYGLELVDMMLYSGRLTLDVPTRNEEMTRRDLAKQLFDDSVQFHPTSLRAFDRFFPS